MHTIGMVAGVRGARCSPVRLSLGPSAAIVATTVALVAACGPAEEPGRAEVLLSVGYAAPAAVGLDQLIAPLTGEGLVRTGPDGRIEPVLADSWKIDGSGTTITMSLRQDVLFHDGSPMTADDVKMSLDRLLEDPSAILRNAVLGDIESIEAPARQRVVNQAESTVCTPIAVRARRPYRKAWFRRPANRYRTVLR